MTVQEGTYNLLKQLRTIYPESEASQITDWVMERITGSNKAERMIYKNEPLTDAEQALLSEFSERLLQHEPVQYVLIESCFMEINFMLIKMY